MSIKSIYKVFWQVQTLSFYVTSITAAAAVAGTILGSYFTYWHNRKIEEKRIFAQKQEEKEFNARIRELVLSELTGMSNMLKDLLTHEETRLKESKTLIEGWKTLPLQYTKMSLQRRAKVFDVNLLPYVENIYQQFSWFIQVYPIEFENFMSQKITLTDLREKLDISAMKTNIDNVMEGIRKTKYS
jgi:hypothetical protein